MTDEKEYKSPVRGVEPERPSQGAAAAARVEYKHDLVVWLEKKDACVSTIYEAVQCTGINRLKGFIQKLIQRGILLWMRQSYLS